MIRNYLDDSCIPTTFRAAANTPLSFSSAMCVNGAVLFADTSKRVNYKRARAIACREETSRSGSECAECPCGRYQTPSAKRGASEARSKKEDKSEKRARAGAAAPVVKMHQPAPVPPSRYRTSDAPHPLVRQQPLCRYSSRLARKLSFVVTFTLSRRARARKSFARFCVR